MDEIRGPDKKDLAYEDYLSGMKYKDIAEKHGVSESAVKSWASRFWKKEKLQPSKKVATKKKGGQPGNKNATGPPQNKNAEKHGFFSKWLPEETAEIMKAIQNLDPLDILWDNIQLQYTAIIRAQRLMYVRDQQDVTTTKIGEGYSDSGSSEKWEVQQAWDKHATFLNAQSRAMKTLEGMIKQYEELMKSDLATEEQKERINKLRAEINKITGEDEETEDLTETDADIYG